jgi:hypothetical protein
VDAHAYFYPALEGFTHTHNVVLNLFVELGYR